MDPGGEAPPPGPVPDLPGTDLQKYKRDRNAALPGIACKISARPRIGHRFQVHNDRELHFYK